MLRISSLTNFRKLRIHLVQAMLVLAGLSTTLLGQPPSFSKVFNPDTIGPGSASTLTFTITNGSATAVDNLAFTDSFPSEITIAGPAGVTSTCGAGLVSAPDGGGVISLTGGQVGAFSYCEITVNVTSSDIGEGPYTNTTGDLTSDAGNSGPASADLTVTESLPGFTKSFAPVTVPFGQRSTVTLTIDNTQNGASSEYLSFVDNLPVGMVVANPSNAVTDCGTAPISPTLTAVSGTGTIALSYFGTGTYPGVSGGETCTVTVDVIGGAVGLLGNVTDELFVDSTSAGKAAAVLEVTGFEDLLQLTKEFTDDPVHPGGTATLEFTVTNKSRDDAATDITFSDDLGSTLSGLTATLPPTPDPPCGAGSSLAFSTGVLSMTGGSLPAGNSCTFSVELSVPGTTAPGTYPNTAGPISGDVGGSPETGNVAGDLLFVVSYPILTKEFTDDPVGAGGTVTLEFTITNPETTSTMSDITFGDELTAGSGDGEGTSGFLPFPVSIASPALPAAACGGTLALVSFGGDRQGLELTGGSLSAGGNPGDSCTFSVTVDIPTGFPSGNYLNTTEKITAVLDDFAGTPEVTGPPASDILVVAGPPRLSKEFTDDPVLPGGTVTLEFNLVNQDGSNAVSAISFSDDLGAALTGLTLTSELVNTCGGTVSGLSTSNFGYTGGSLAIGDSCTITVLVTVPATPPGGVFRNTTSSVTATVAGLAVEGPAASDDLIVTGLLFSKEFTDDPVIAGGTATLVFTLDNTTGTTDATGIIFTDDLASAIPGLAATLPPTPDPPCGVGSSLIGASGNTFLIFTGGSVPAGASCSFSVNVLVPTTIPNSPGPDIPTPDDVYANITSSLSATVGGSVTFPPARDELTVNTNLLALTKEFTNDPVKPGDTVTLEFNLTNLSATETITDIDFDDDLDATLTGLVATGAPVNTCGGAAAALPAGLFEYSGGTLLPGAICTITLNVDVPSAPLPGNVFTNTTTGVTGKVGTLDVSGDPASDDLKVELQTFSKSFDGPTSATGTAQLTFTITNLDSVNPVNGLAFSDDLDAVISGMVASVLPATPCGPGSSLVGTSFLSFTGGSLAAAGSPGDSCTVDVTVTIPSAAAVGTFINTTSDLFSSGLPIADPATATLSIEPPPTFSKIFAPSQIGLDLTSTLTFTIDNSAGSLPATSLDFTDNLPAALVISASPNASTSCTGGTLTAVSGTGVVSYTGGTVAANSSCTVSVDVTGSTAGSHVNITGDLTSSQGNSGDATDTLEVIPPPAFGKSFTPITIVQAGISTLTLVIDNTGNSFLASGLSFVDTFPGDVVVAAVPNASSTCGGTITAVAGAGSITFSGGSVGANATCTVEVDVTGMQIGNHQNITGELTSSNGNSGTASASLGITRDPNIGGEAQNIPTLDFWGILILAGLLALVAIWRIRI